MQAKNSDNYKWGMLFVAYICKKRTHMKRSYLLIALVSGLFISRPAQAQIPVVSKVADKITPEFTIGIKLGANFQTVTSKTTLDDAYNAGIMGGLFIGLTKGKWGVQVEGIARSAKITTKADPNTGTASATLNALNLDVPVLLEYKVIPRVWLQVGPQFTSVISSSTTGTPYKYNYFLKTSEFQALAGLQVILPGRFTAGARYVLGLTDVNNLPTTLSAANEKWNNHSIQLYAGFRFM